MSVNKTLSHTNFSGIKYSNNPLTVDPNSFSTVENVYLNKYNALISRPPINVQEYSSYAYGDYVSMAVVPIELKLVAKYDLSDGGVVYVIQDTRVTPNLYKLRYETPLGAYSDVMNYIPIGE